MDIQFLGAAREVTGSCHGVRCGDRRLLIGCGLIQGALFPFDPAEIDAVVLTHAHLDHSGRLPPLVKAGYRGPIYTHRATPDLCHIMLKDAEHENRRRQRQGKRLVEPLYTRSDAEKAMRQFQALDYDVEKKSCRACRCASRTRDTSSVRRSWNSGSRKTACGASWWSAAIWDTRARRSCATTRSCARPTSSSSKALTATASTARGRRRSRNWVSSFTRRGAIRATS